MKTVACPSCNSVNSTDESVCVKCGESLTAAKIQQSVEELKRLTDKFQQANAPSFYSFNGFGTTLLDYRARADGTYEATRWVIALFLPIFPLSAYVIQPTAQEVSYGSLTSRFQIVGKTPLSAARILRTYLLAVAGLLPIISGFAYSNVVNRTLGGLPAFGAMILCFAWAVYIIMFKLKNEGSAYKSVKAS
jgi:hypothetical protein